MKKVIIILISIILIIFGIYMYKESQKDYINGNVLHFSYLTEQSAKESGVAPAWINNGFVFHLLFRPLVKANQDLTNYKPALAESYSISNDGLIYTFTLPKGQKWTDNTDITTKDILFSIDSAKNSTVVAPIYEQAFKRIENIHLIDDYTVQIILSEANNTFLHAISQFFIFPKHILSQEDKALSISEFWDNPIGSSMYMLTEKTEDYYKLEINPLFHGTKPKIEEIYLHKTRTIGLDLYLTTNIADMVNYRSMRGYTEHLLPLDFYRYFLFNIKGNDGNQNPAMQDINIRNTIASSIDTQYIIEAIYLNMANPLAMPNTKKFSTDRAKEFLALTNYDLNRPLRIGVYFKDTTSLYFIQAVKSNLEDIGFIVELVEADSYDELIQNRNFDFVIKDLVLSSPRDWVAELSSSHSSARLLGINDEFDALLHKLQLEPNYERQEEIVIETRTLAASTVFRYPVLKLSQGVYTSHRVQLPKNYTFNNPWFITDIQFEQWEIKKQ